MHLEQTHLPRKKKEKKRRRKKKKKKKIITWTPEDHLFFFLLYPVLLQNTAIFIIFDWRNSQHIFKHIFFSTFEHGMIKLLLTTISIKKKNQRKFLLL
jgi:hypothetical protein